MRGTHTTQPDSHAAASYGRFGPLTREKAGSGYYLRGSCCTARRLYDAAIDSTHRGPMNESNLTRRTLLAAAAAIPLASLSAETENIQSAHPKDINMTSRTFTKTPAPDWLLAFWREIDDKTWGKGFDCFKEDAIANLGVSDWHGREAIRENLRAFIDKGFTAHHEVVEYWDGGSLKVFRGFVTMRPNDPTQKTVRPAMTHFFYMDEKDPSKVAHWYGSVGPVAF